MDRCIDRWMDGQMDRYIVGQMDEAMDINVWIHRLTDWMDNRRTSVMLQWDSAALI
jgi:hypothetical protein